MNFDLAQGVTLLVPLLLSLSFHEWAHAWSAWRLGDDTAERAGRLTLNPVSHIDLLGTIALPLLLAMSGGAVFGWAKPVPVNPARFRRGVHMGRGMMLTAAAGPLSNLILATACTVIFGLLARFSPELILPGQGIRTLLQIMIRLNITLALFNLIPVPPLDGSRVVEGMMPLRFRPQWESFARLAPFALLAVFFFGWRLISGPSAFVLDLLQRLVNVIA